MKFYVGEKMNQSRYWCYQLSKEIFGLKTAPTVFCKTDNKSLEKHLKSSKVIQDFGLTVDILRVQEMVKLCKIEVQWVDKTHQWADKLLSTKSMSDGCS